MRREALVRVYNGSQGRVKTAIKMKWKHDDMYENESEIELSATL